MYETPVAKAVRRLLTRLSVPLQTHLRHSGPEPESNQPKSLS